MKDKQKKISQGECTKTYVAQMEIFDFVMDFAKMRGSFTHAISYALKNTLVWMKDKQKKISQGECTKTYMTQREIFDFVMYFAKIACFYSHSIVPVGLGVISYNTRLTPFTSLKILSVIFASKS